MNTKAPSRTKGYRPIFKTQHISGANDSFVVPVDQLADLLNAKVEELNRTLFKSSALGSADGEDTAGAVNYIVHGAVTSTNETYSFEQLTRRLWSIRAQEGRAVRVEIADALLLGAGVNIEDTDIPTLPAGDLAAREAVEIHQELTDEPLTELEAKRLERSLLHFAQGYIHEFHVIDQQVAKGLEAFFAAAAEKPELEVAYA